MCSSRFVDVQLKDRFAEGFTDCMSSASSLVAGFTDCRLLLPWSWASPTVVCFFLGRVLHRFSSASSFPPFASPTAGGSMSRRAGHGKCFQSIMIINGRWQLMNEIVIFYRSASLCADDTFHNLCGSVYMCMCALSLRRAAGVSCL